MSLALILTCSGIMSGTANATVTVVNTGAKGRFPSVSGNIIAFEGPDKAIMYYDISTGLTTNTGAVGVRPSVSGSIIAFHTGGVIRYYDILTGSLVDTGAIGIEPSISGSIIAFRTHESMIGVDLNDDGDLNDWVIMYYDISAPAGTELVNTKAEGVNPEISGSIIAFEWPRGTIRYYDISDKSVTNTDAIGNVPSVSGSIIAFVGPGKAIMYYDISTGLVTNTGAIGINPSVSGSIIAFHTDVTVDSVIMYLIIVLSTNEISSEVDAFLADGSIDNKGIAQALHAHLRQAQAKIDKGDIMGAKKTLNRFIDFLEGPQSGKHITTDAAQTLIIKAQALINSL